MDLTRNELDRELRDLDRRNAAVMPRWRELLERVFSGDVETSTREKAGLLGLPDRRGFLRIGGIGIAGAALLAACGDDDDPSATPLGGAADDGAATDIVLANTAISLETLAIDTYTVAAESGLVESAAVAAAATLFAEHHVAHRDALVATVDGAGATPFTGTNAAVKSAIVDPALAAATTEADVIALAYELETAAAQTYVYAAGVLSTPRLRSTIMTIGGIEARHAAVLGQVGSLGVDTVFPNAFFPAENPLPEAGVITG